MSLFMRRFLSSAAAATATTGAVVVGNTVYHENVEGEPRQEAHHLPVHRPTLARDFNREDPRDPDGTYEIVDDKAFFPTTHLAAINPSEAEVDAAFAVLNEAPHILAGHYAPGSRGEAMVHMLPDLIKNKQRVQEVKAKFARHRAILEAKNNEAEQCTTSLSAEDTKLSADALWMSLRADFPCACCLDVLAAPVALSKCSHSFCGACVNELHNSCVQSDLIGTTYAVGKSCVVCSCPECREPFQGGDWVYERGFDETIMKRVEEVPNCEMKTDFLQRRSDFLEAEKARKAAEAQAKANPLPASIERMLTGEHGRAAEDQDDAADGWIGHGSFAQEALEAWATPFIMAAVIAVIVIARYA